MKTGDNKENEILELTERYYGYDDDEGQVLLARETNRELRLNALGWAVFYLLFPLALAAIWNMTDFVIRDRAYLIDWTAIERALTLFAVAWPPTVTYLIAKFYADGSHGQREIATFIERVFISSQVLAGFVFYLMIAVSIVGVIAWLIWQVVS